MLYLNTAPRHDLLLKILSSKRLLYSELCTYHYGLLVLLLLEPQKLFLSSAVDSSLGPASPLLACLVVFSFETRSLLSPHHIFILMLFIWRLVLNNVDGPVLVDFHQVLFNHICCFDLEGGHCCFLKCRENPKSLLTPTESDVGENLP